MLTEDVIFKWRCSSSELIQILMDFLLLLMMTTGFRFKVKVNNTWNDKQCRWRSGNTLWGLILYLQTFSESSLRLQNTPANSMNQTSFPLTTFMQFGASKSYDSNVSQAGDECNFIQIPAASPEAASIWVYGLFCFFPNWPWLLTKIFCKSGQSILKSENFVHQSWQLAVLNTCLGEYRVPLFMTFSDPNRERVPVFVQVKCFAAKVARSCFQIKPDSPHHY